MKRLLGILVLVLVMLACGGPVVAAGVTSAPVSTDRAGCHSTVIPAPSRSENTSGSSAHSKDMVQPPQPAA